MNLTYANIVRFPRELERHGIAFLVPYLTLMLIVGVPIVLLEMALGQFLGQGSAQSWKASPFLKGASIIGRIGSWIGTIWVTMQMSLALLYIGQMSFSSVPFTQCPSKVQTNNELHYEPVAVLGQACLQKTFLRPVWDYSVSFGLLAIGLVFLWVIIMMWWVQWTVLQQIFLLTFIHSTHSSRVNRRSLLMFGTITMGLLMFQTGWQVTSTIQEGFFPDMWPFRVDVLWQSSTWFYALIQVIFSTQIGVGAIPVVTGKFLYKGDAIRTCVVYMCFNFLVTIIAAAFYMTTFGQHNTTSNVPTPFPDLTTITSIYDRAFIEEEHSYLRSLIPSLAYLMVVISGLTSVSIAIYTSSRLLKRHPNYIMCLVGMFVAIASLICPNFNASRYFDMRLAGTVIVCALVFDIISIAWVYGSKDLSNDLEFSIGRPIMKLWMVLWSIMPLVLIGLTAWWIAQPSRLLFDPIVDIVPRWIPFVICASIIIMFAGYEVSKQVDYNMCTMIQESTRPAKDWGPADPLVRHAWKQWKSVCDDTGERDFTLRRRGTKDWTSSIKKGQYSHASRNQSVISGNKYIVNGKNTASTFTGGSNSPNYSGSVFGDSAIEEDMNSDKFPSNHHDAYPSNESRSRKSSTKRSSDASQRSTYMYNQHNLENGHAAEPAMTAESNYHSQKIPIRVSNGRRNDNFTSRIEILAHDPPPSQFQPYQSTFMTNNPLSHHIHDVNFSGPFNDKFGHQLFQQDFNSRHHSSTQNGGHLINNIRISDCSDGSGSLSTKTTNTATTHEHRDPYSWRKKSRNMEEFSTEL